MERAAYGVWGRLSSLARAAVVVAAAGACVPASARAQDDAEDEPLQLRPPTLEPLEMPEEDGGAPAEPPADGEDAAGEDAAGDDAYDDEAYAEDAYGEDAYDEAGADAEDVEEAPEPMESPDALAPEAGERVPTDEEAETAEAAGRLQQSDPTRFEDAWTAPAPVLTLHGYLRTRLELQDRFHLGRATGPDLDELDDGLSLAPFDRFRFPTSGEGRTGSLIFGNMRFRIEPTLSLGEHVRIHAQFDVFDNLVLGSEGARAAYDPLLGFTSSAREASIVAKRAWAEATARGIGQIRFGRMGWHWGLGMLANGGEGLDDDLQTDVDRIMAITKLAGLYWMASWDFVNEGVLSDRMLDIQVPAIDANEGDDTTQFTFAVARRQTPEERRTTLARGDVAVDAGALFIYRSNARNFEVRDDGEGAVPSPGTVTGDPPGSDGPFYRGYEAFIPDVFVDLAWGPLRIGVEGVAVFGTVNRTRSVLASGAGDDGDTYRNLLLRQYGVVFESEVRLLEDNLRFYFDTGFASGDSDTVNGDQAHGLTLQNDLFTQRSAVDDGQVSTFVFHPNYRIDLILWRNIMTRVAGAYYFKPGVSYDFLRSPFGELLRARLDVVWSRASNPTQSFNGRSDDLGVEIDVGVVYRSEDGPEIWDGFYAMAQYGFLFALPGLNNPRGVENVDLQNAQTVRVLLGVQY